MSKQVNLPTNINVMSKDDVINQSLNTNNVNKSSTNTGRTFLAINATPNIPEYAKYIPTRSDFENLHKIDVDAYKDYMPGGKVYSWDTDVLNEIRAENQPMGEKFLRSSLNPLNLAWNIGTGIVEGFAYLPELPDLFTGGDFSNDIIELLQSTRSLPGELMTGGKDIYLSKEDMNKVINPMSAEWWFETSGQLIESIGEFAVLAGTIGGGISKVAGSLGKLGKVGSATGNTLNIASRFGGQLLTSATLSYMEGAMSAKQSYDEIYAELTNKGMSDVEAKKIASKSTANIARLNMALVTPLNMTSVGRLFTKNNKIAKETIKTIGKKLAGSSTADDMLKILSNTDGYITKQSVGKILGLEAIQEAVEEEANLISEYTGKRQAGLEDYNKTATWLEGAIDKVFSAEGALTAILGAVGGIGQTGAMHFTPVYQKFDSNGKLTGLESAYKQENRLRQEQALNKVNNLKADIEDLVKYQKELADSVNPDGTIDDVKREEAINKINNITAFRSVMDGTSSNLIKLYENIGKVSNTTNKKAEALRAEAQSIQTTLQSSVATPVVKESAIKRLEAIQKELLVEENRTDAMRNGLSEGIRADGSVDNEYVKIANEKIGQIKQFQKDYDTITDKYGFTDLENFAQLPSEVFALYSNIVLKEKYINRLQSAKAEQEGNFMLKDAAIKNNTLIKEEKIQEQEKQLEELKKEYEELTTPTGRKKFTELWKERIAKQEEAIKEFNNSKIKAAAKDNITKLNQNIAKIKEDTIKSDIVKNADKHTKDITGVDAQLKYLSEQEKLVTDELTKLKADPKSDKTVIDATQEYATKLTQLKDRLTKSRAVLTQNRKSDDERIIDYLDKNGYIGEGSQRQESKDEEIVDDTKVKPLSEITKDMQTAEGRKKLNAIIERSETNISKKEVKPKGKSKRTKKTEEEEVEEVEETPKKPVVIPEAFLAKHPESAILIQMDKEFLDRQFIGAIIYETGIPYFSKKFIDNGSIALLHTDKKGNITGYSEVNFIFKNNKTFITPTYIAIYVNKQGTVLFDTNSPNASVYASIESVEKLGYENIDEISNAVSETRRNVTHVEQDMLMNMGNTGSVNIFSSTIQGRVEDAGDGNLRLVGVKGKKTYALTLTGVKEGDEITIRFLRKEEAGTEQKYQDDWEANKDNIAERAVVIEYKDENGNTIIGYLNKESYLEREIKLTSILLDTDNREDVEQLIDAINSIDNNTRVEDIFTDNFIQSLDNLRSQIVSNKGLENFLDTNDIITLQKDIEHLKRLFNYSNQTIDYESILNSLKQWKNKLVSDLGNSKKMRQAVAKQGTIKGRVAKKSSGNLIIINNKEDYKLVEDSFELNDEQLQELPIFLATSDDNIINIEDGEIEKPKYRGKFTKGVFYVKVPDTDFYVPLITNNLSEDNAKFVVDKIKQLHTLAKDLSKEGKSKNANRRLSIKKELETIVYVENNRKPKNTDVKSDKFKINDDNIKFGDVTIYFETKDGKYRDGVKTPVIVQVGDKNIDMYWNDTTELESILTSKVRISIDRKNLINPKNKVKYLKERVKVNVGKLVDNKGKRIANVNPTGKYKTQIHIEYVPTTPGLQKIDEGGAKIQEGLTVLYEKDTKPVAGRKFVSLAEVANIAELPEGFNNLVTALTNNGTQIRLINKKGTGEDTYSTMSYNTNSNVITIYMPKVNVMFTTDIRYNAKGDRFTNKQYFVRTLLHEMMHPILRQGLESNPEFQQRLTEFRDELKAILESDMTLWNEIFGSDKQHIFDDIFKVVDGKPLLDEVLTYALTDPRFAEVLNKIKSKKASGKTFLNDLIQLFVDLLRDMFGVDITKGSMLEELYDILSANVVVENYSRIENIKGDDVDATLFAIDENVTEKIIEDRLEDRLTKFLDKLNVTVEQRNNIKEATGYGAIATTDLLYKTILIKEGYTKELLPKEVAYIAYSFLGRKSKLRTDLINSIDQLDNFNDIFTKYQERSPQLNEYKIKELIVVDFLADAIQNNWDTPKESYINKEAEYWEIKGNSKLEKRIKYILGKIRRFFETLFNINKLDKNEVKDLMNDIANDILQLNVRKFGGELTAEQQLTNYEDTIAKDLKANEIVQNFQNIDLILTGSLSLRKQGTLYRSGEENLHDLDFTVQSDKFFDIINDLIEVPITSEFFNLSEVSKLEYLDNYRNMSIKKIFKDLDNIEIIKQIKELYPSFIITNSFYGKNEEYTISGDIDGYAIDLFFVKDSSLDNVEKGFQDWQPIFKAKIGMGRAKDIKDFANYIPFNTTTNKLSQEVGLRHFNFNTITSNKNVDNIVLFAVDEFAPVEKNTVLSAIDENGVTLEVRDVLTQSVYNIANLVYFNKMQNEKTSDFEKELYNVAIDDKLDIKQNTLTILRNLAVNENLTPEQRRNLEYAIFDIVKDGVIWKNTILKFNSLVNTTKKSKQRNILENENNEYDEEAEGQTKAFDDKNTLTQSSKNLATALIKSKIGRYLKVKEVKADGTKVYEYNKHTGLPEYLNFTDVYPTLSRVLANKLDITDMLEEVDRRATYFDLSLVALYNDLLYDIDFAAQVFNTMGQIMLPSVYNKYNEVGDKFTIEDARKINNPVYRVANEWINDIKSAIESYFNYIQNKKENVEFVEDTNTIKKLEALNNDVKNINKDIKTIVNKYNKNNPIISKEDNIALSKLLSDKLALIDVIISPEIFQKELTRAGNSYLFIKNKIKEGGIKVDSVITEIDNIINWVIDTIDDITDNKITKEDLSKSNFFDRFGSVNILADIYQYYNYEVTELSNSTVAGNNIHIAQKPFYMAKMFILFKRAIDNTVGSIKARNELENYLKQIISIKSFQYDNWLWAETETVGDTEVELNNGFVNYTINENGEKEFDSLNIEFINNLVLSLYDGAKNVSTSEGIEFEQQSTLDWNRNVLLMFSEGVASSTKEVNGDTHMTIPFAQPSDSKIEYVLTVNKNRMKDYEYDALQIGVTEIEKVLRDKRSGVFNKILNILKGEMQQKIDNYNLIYEYKEVDVKLEDGTVVKEWKHTIKDGFWKNDIVNHLQKYKHYQKHETVTLEDGTTEYRPVLLDENGNPTGNVFKFLNLMWEDGTTFDMFIEQNDNLEFYGNNPITRNYINLANKFVAQYISDVVQYGMDKYSIYSEDIRENMELLIPEFVLNMVIGYTEQQNWFVGNIHEYKDFNDTNKRAKELFAPATRYDTRAMGTKDVPVVSFKSVTVTDIIRKSKDFDKLYAEVKKIVIKDKQLDEVKDAAKIEKLVNAIVKKYKDIESTDGQSYITVAETKRRLKGLGRFKQFEKLFERLEEIENKPTENLTTDDISLMLAPFKNYMYGRRFDNKLNALISKQIKNSEFILFPQLIKGTDLETINQYMLDNEIGQWNYSSAVKVGAQTINNVTESNLEEVLADGLLGVEEIMYDDLGLQLDMPEHHEDTKNLLGTQMKRLILTNIPDNLEFDIIISTGELTETEEPIIRKMKGFELKEHYFELLNTNIIEDANNLLTRLGAIKLENGKWKTNELGYIELNDEKFAEILKEEVEARGLAENYKVALNIDAQSKTFSLPLFINGMVDKYQAIFTSLFTNSIVKQKIPGSHNVQVSGAFFNFKDWTKLKSSNTNYEKFGIQFTDEFAEKVKERGDSQLRMYGEGDKLILEVIMPPHSSDFYTKGQQININTVPKDLLQQVGYRIPTDAKHSMIVLEVVGWSSKIHSSTVILPDEFMIMSGSDFDIDTVYFMSKHFKAITDTKTELKSFKIIDYKDAIISFDIRYNTFVNSIPEVRQVKAELIPKLKELNLKIQRNWENQTGKLRNLIGNKFAEENEISELYDAKFDLEDDINKLIENLDIIEEELYLANSENPEAKLIFSIFGKDITNREYIEQLEADRAEILLDIKLARNLYNDVSNRLEETTESKITKEDVQERYIKRKSKNVELLQERKNILDELNNKIENIYPKSKFEQLTLEQQNVRQARDNRIIDINKAILNNEHFKLERVEPGFYQSMIDAYNAVESVDIVNKGKYNIDFHPSTFRGQSNFRELNMVGRVLKGIAANANSFNAVGQAVKFMLPNSIAYTAKYNKGSIEYSFEELQKMYGVDNVMEDETSYVVTHGNIAHNLDGSFNNIAGIPTTQHAAEILSNILDIVKYPLAKNINTYTFPTFVSIVSQGVTIEHATWFITQQSLRDLYDKWTENNSVIKGSNVGLEQELVTKMYQTYLYITAISGTRNPKVYMNKIVKEYNRRLDELSKNKEKYVEVEVQEKLYDDIFQKADEKVRLDKFNFKYHFKQLLDTGVMTFIKPRKNTEGLNAKQLANEAIKAKIFNDIFKVDIAKTPFSTEDLIELHKTSKIVTEPKTLTTEERLEYYRNQLRILENFKIYKRAADTYSTAVKALSVDKLGASPSLNVTHDWLQNIYKLGGIFFIKDDGLKSSSISFEDEEIISLVKPEDFNTNEEFQIADDKEYQDLKILLDNEELTYEEALEHKKGELKKLEDKNVFDTLATIGDTKVMRSKKRKAISGIENKDIVEAVFPNLEYKGVKIFGGGKSVYSPIETMGIYANLLSLNVGSKYFITEHSIVKDALDILSNEVGMFIDDTVIKQFNNYVLTYFLKLYKHDLFNINNEYAEILLGLNSLSKQYNNSPKFEDFMVMSVANKIKYYKKNFTNRIGNISHIVNYLESKTTSNDIERNKFQILQVINTKGDVLKDNQITELMLQIYKTGDEFDRDLIKDLIRYTVATNGYSFGLNSISKLIPNEILVEEGVGNYFKQFESASINSVNSYDLVRSFIQNNWGNQKYVPRIFPHKYVTTYDEQGNYIYVIKKGLPDWNKYVKYNDDGVVDKLEVPRGILSRYSYMGNKYKRILGSKWIVFEDRRISAKKDKDGKRKVTIKSEELYEINYELSTENHLIYTPVEKKGVRGVVETNPTTIFEQNKVGYKKAELNVVENNTNNETFKRTSAKQTKAKQQTLFEPATVYLEPTFDFESDGVIETKNGLRNTIIPKIAFEGENKTISNFVKGLYNRGVYKTFYESIEHITAEELGEGSLFTLNKESNTLTINSTVAANMSRVEFEYRFTLVMTQQILNNKKSGLATGTVNDIKKSLGIESNIYDKFIQSMKDVVKYGLSKDSVSQNKEVQSFINKC